MSMSELLLTERFNMILKKEHWWSGFYNFWIIYIKINFIQSLTLMNLPKNINLSEESPNFPSLTFFVLSNVNSRLAFLVFLFGGDFLEFSRPLACIWKLFRPCSNPSNLKQTKVKIAWFYTGIRNDLFRPRFLLLNSPRNFLSLILWGLRISKDEFNSSSSSYLPPGVT